jgi:hypothetical protein
MHILLVAPPLVKPCEPPAGLACLAGAVRAAGGKCTVWDAAVEGMEYLLGRPVAAADTWSRRAQRHLEENLRALRTPELYVHPARYRRAVGDVNRIVEQAGREQSLVLQLANYQDSALSPLESKDLLQAAARPEENIFFPWFGKHLQTLISRNNPDWIGFSLNFLSQALVCFAMVGFVKKHYPRLPVVLGGGLVTSWLRNPGWNDPFAGLVDSFIAGPGEQPLLELLGLPRQAEEPRPDFSGLNSRKYLAPGWILPYAASSGCYWSRCLFCPETAEGNPYTERRPDRVLEDLASLAAAHNPVLIHFLDNALSPRLLTALADRPPGIPWYGFARASSQLADAAFCRRLRRSGCVLLKLGLESGDQGVLDAMDKGIELGLVSRVLQALESAGIAVYVYLLFGTPAESVAEARRTLDFIVRHRQAVTFLNLAVFNLPVCGPEAATLALRPSYDGDLCLYRDFIHPRGWNRKDIRRFLEREFKKHPAIVPILQRDPYIFTSNHAPFFSHAFGGKELRDRP